MKDNVYVQYYLKLYFKLMSRKRDADILMVDTP
ncbi:hypothetical protein Murru_2805 [Allomuricauda ruestringensis DSM 13258]|uniref:Uncharacterized protein n=1 Tax=Allomuricauda ruestringensis (strain DSM 13258 / CIP 107369 / LMG 19739 / B1) TaxID=886377 RepID=G2PIT4_ALLRU|nr:hypothetical protein Murru_2805 [Allomuricauda ruestringensis DSM 13258]